MAGEAPICNGKLFEELGYTANTTAAQAILDGSYIAPEGSNQATLDLFVEVANIRRQVPQDSISICITPQQWKRYWKAVNEETSSSESGLHFGNYIVGSTLDLITHYHGARVSVVIAHAIQLERWSRTIPKIGVCPGADNQGLLLIPTNSTQKLTNLRRTLV